MANDSENLPSRRARLTAFLARHSNAERPARFSTMLRLVGEEADERIKLSTLVDAFQDRAFGALMFILAAPNAIPLPPGTSAVLGLPLVLVSAQLALGHRRLWLPAALASRTIPRQDFQSLVGRALPVLRRVERVLAPRLTILFGPVSERLIGSICLLLAIVLFLPIPLGNMLPGIAVSLFALALLQRDGVAALAGGLAAAVSLGLLVAVSGALWAATKAFIHALM